mmetsp:Transcript_80927/g.187970  ORF Transcript_80927/g.187970 Transcript_80927/m.187970 type:complete len:256 (+) Transcript_80927:1189-1956(+)
MLPVVAGHLAVAQHPVGRGALEVCPHIIDKHDVLEPHVPQMVKLSTLIRCKLWKPISGSFGNTVQNVCLVVANRAERSPECPPRAPIPVHSVGHAWASSHAPDDTEELCEPCHHQEIQASHRASRVSCQHCQCPDLPALCLRQRPQEVLQAREPAPLAKRSFKVVILLHKGGSKVHHGDVVRPARPPDRPLKLVLSGHEGRQRERLITVKSHQAHRWPQLFAIKASLEAVDSECGCADARWSSRQITWRGKGSAH